MINQSIRRLWAHFSSDSLFRNSVYLMLSTGVMGVLGFLFWILASHLYAPSDIGLATSIISAAGLMVGLSTLGLNNVLIRFLAQSSERLLLFSTSFVLTTITSVIVSLAFILWASLSHSPLLAKSPVVVSTLFAFYVVTLTMNGMIEGAFIAHRVAKYVFFKNLWLSLSKIALLLVFIRTAYLGIVAATLFATLIGVSLGLIILVRRLHYSHNFSLGLSTLSKMRSFAIGNYVGSIFGMLPSTLMPLIVLSRLGASSAAYYYIPAMILALLNVIPSATAQSLFAEVSHDEENLRHYILQALRNLFALLIPATALVIVFAPIALGLFGHTYQSEGTVVLRILALSSLFGGMNYIGDAILNIQKRPVAYIIMNVLNSILVVGLGYIVAPHGLVAIALATLVGQIITIIIYVIVNIPLIGRLSGFHHGLDKGRKRNSDTTPST